MELITVLGIDPGTRHTGMAEVIKWKGRLMYKGSWTQEIKGDDLTERLLSWANDLRQMLRSDTQYAVVAVENPMVVRNAKTIDALARFVGVTLVEARRRHILTVEYRPREHRKLSVGAGIISIGTNHLKEREALWRLMKKRIEKVPAFWIFDEHKLDALSLAVAAATQVEEA